MDGEHSVLAVVGAGEHDLELQARDLRLQRLDLLREVVRQRVVAEFDQFQRVAEALLQVLPAFNFVAQPRGAPGHLLRVVGVVPQVGGSDGFVEPGQFGFFAG